MSSLMTIGDFSRAVRMTAKALRFYHQNDILPRPQLEGNFPGGVVDLLFRFTVRGDKISELIIAL